MARRLGGSGGVARLALETMRSAYRELPGMSEAAARGVGDAITQLVHLSMLDLAGIGTAMTQREALRERIKQHVAEHLGDPRLSVDSVALGAQLQPAPSLQRLLRRARRRGRLHPARAASRPAARPSTTARTATARSPTIALGFGFSSMAHFSRVFRAHVGVAPSDYRRAAGSLAA